MTLQRGHVIGLRRKASGIIWSISKTHAIIIPIGACNGVPRHRAEVRFEDPIEILACGISLTFPVAGCHQLFQMARATADEAQVIGEAPQGLMIRIVHAVAREANAQAAERRGHFNDNTGWGIVAVS